MPVADPVEVMPMFMDAFRKVNWAVCLKVVLIENLKFYRENGLRVRISDIVQGQDFREVLMEAAELPPVGLPVGDIIRNLRGAMDAAVSAIYRAQGKNENQAYWVFGEDTASLQGALKGSLDKVGLDRLSNFFLDVVPSTRDQNFLLWGMNQIDRANKHRNIAVVVTSAFVTEPSFVSDDGVTSMISFNNRTLLEPGQGRLFRIPAGAIIDTSSDAEPSLSVTFGQTEVFSGKDVLAVIDQLIDLVMDAIKKLQIAYVSAYPS